MRIKNAEDFKSLSNEQQSELISHMLSDGKKDWSGDLKDSVYNLEGTDITISKSFNLADIQDICTTLQQNMVQQEAEVESTQDPKQSQSLLLELQVRTAGAYALQAQAVSQVVEAKTKDIDKKKQV